ncbi:M20/M25/M40 family metallo-hydrolase [Enterococcus ureasiticus]|uniref:M42 family metallopeptidase n=1 Tax=Enterococcus ureasiticus TaxID=903984 RepID=UPI001A8E0406|nr:M20/M25/M40 family metallo-hydrolase [Enterococcus ureasiticus]MBO0475139.1 M20/M25/M40 family metallo-hydrolase [Enterococcus ureasiticus]
MTKKESLHLIERLSNASGVSGFEDDVVAIAKEFSAPFAEVSEDHIRNVYMKVGEHKADKPTIVFDAHSDEVGFIVQAIKPNGTLRFLPLGGWVPNTVPAHRVRIKTANGNEIPGIIASKPPHFMTDAERKEVQTIDDMVIDVGCTSAEEVVEKLNIAIGDPVIPDVTFEYLEATDLMLGKAFDCRIGCACLLETLKKLSEKESEFNLIGTMTAQEEVGERGATVAMNNIKPDLAIVFEGCPADDTFSEEYMIQSGLKRGPMLRNFDVSMITNPRFQRFAKETAEKYGLPMQSSVRKGGGTNGAIINLTNKGVPAIVIGVPVRYAHTHYGYVAYEDYQAAHQLAVAIVNDLTKAKIDSF